MIQENYIELLQESFRKNWDYPAMTDFGGASYKYKEVAKKIAELHILFEECGLQKGEKVALISRNLSTWAIAFEAVLTYGAVAVPILPDFNPKDVHNIVTHSEASLLFVSDLIWDKLDEREMPALKGVFSLSSFKLLSERENGIAEILKKSDSLFAEKYPNSFSPADIIYTEVPGSELMILNYTSGTTGFSKGVMLTGNNIAGNVTFAQRKIGFDTGDRIVSHLPLAHCYACAFDLLWPLTVGVHITFIPTLPTPNILLEAFRKVKPNIVLTVPLIIEKIYKKQILPSISKPAMKVLINIPGIRRIIFNKILQKLKVFFGGKFNELVLGGAPLNPEVEAFLYKIKFPYTIGYGMTECGPLISYSDWKEFKRNSCGEVLDIMECRIDSDDPENIEGEILVRGENLMVGYYNNEEATREAIDDEGWLHTGDLGLLDKDNVVYIKGRAKNMILGPSGQNIHPEEIEAKLNNLPYVSESIVLEKAGRLIALVYPDFGALEDADLCNDDLPRIMKENKEELNSSVANYEKIAEIEIRYVEFVKTPKNSIKRYLYMK